MKKRFCLLLYVISFLLMTSFAFATTLYTSDYDNMSTTRDSWLSGIGITAPGTTIDFESGFTDLQNILGTQLAGGLTITGAGNYDGGFITDDKNDLGRSEPLGTYALALNEREQYTLSFETNVSYFAFYFMDNPSFDLKVNYVNDTSEIFQIGGGGTGGYNGSFWAIDSDQAISSISIPVVKYGASDGEYGFDNIEFGFINSSNAVPEPTTIALFSVGLLGLAGVSRKKR